jgi:hypothetical protein
MAAGSLKCGIYVLMVSHDLGRNPSTNLAIFIACRPLRQFLAPGRHQIRGHIHQPVTKDMFSISGNAASITIGPDAGMELTAILEKLCKQRDELDRIIASLQELREHLAPHHLKRRPGRKFMGPGERLEVAERMRRYWAAQRAARTRPG